MQILVEGSVYDSEVMEGEDKAQLSCFRPEATAFIGETSASKPTTNSVADSSLARERRVETNRDSLWMPKRTSTLAQCEQEKRTGQQSVRVWA
eukprot:2807615-Pleurochrysis_carterae.AAC.5